MTPANRLFLSLINRVKYTIIVILILSVVAFFMAQKHYKEKPRFFVAESKLFPVKAESSSPMPTSIFGVQTGSTSDDFYNLSELVDSRTIREEVTKRWVLIDGAQVPVYLQVIEDNNENPRRNKTVELTSDLGLNIINSADVLKTLITVTTNESNFVTLTTKSYKEEFAVALANELIDVLSDFYVKFNEKPLNNNFVQIARTKDSLEYELDRYETAYAKYLDENKFIVKPEQSITEKRLVRKLTSIETALTAVTTRYYSSKDELDNNKPILKVLDRPMQPLTLEKDSYKMYPYAIAILVFLFLMMLSNADLFVRYINDSMAAQRNKILNQES